MAELKEPSLPAEVLQSRACFASRGSDFDLGLANIDFKTTLSMALVSKQVYNFIRPLLYTHVRLTKPSDLLLYARTVSMFPSLATLTKSLWIGPDGDHIQARECWPLSFPPTRMASSLTDSSKLPLGVRPGVQWPFSEHHLDGTQDWITEAASQVILQAAEKVGRFGSGVCLHSSGTRSALGTKLTTEEGHSRVYQVQQHLDMFLTKVRKWQDLASVSEADSTAKLKSVDDLVQECSDQAAFKLHEQSSSTPLRLHDAFDRFDHQLLYERTCASESDDDSDFSEDGAFYPDRDYSLQLHNQHNSRSAASEQGQDSRSRDEVVEDDVMVFSTRKSKSHSRSLIKSVCREVELGKPSLPCLLMMCRIVFARSPNLVCLALTSYLQKAVAGRTQGPSLDHLDSLTLGPTGMQETILAVYLDHEGLANVKRLQVWGTTPHKGLLLGTDNPQCFPSLEIMECFWSGSCDEAQRGVTDRRAFGDSSQTVSAIQRLLGCAADSPKVDCRKPYHLIVWAHPHRIEKFKIWAPEELKNHPLLGLKELPCNLQETMTGYTSRKEALTFLRKRWEEECMQLFGPR